jgi:hypothetical protein
VSLQPSSRCLGADDEHASASNDLIHKQMQRDWNIHITRKMSKMHFLALCRTLCPPASYLPEAHSPSNGAGSRLPEQRHPNENPAGDPQHAGGVCCDPIATCPGPVPSLYALLRLAGATDEEADFGSRVCSAWSAATAQTSETALGCLAHKTLWS